MKRLLMAITLACVLSGTALAGDMPTVGPAPSGTQSSVVVTVILTILSVLA
jgi:hypothetical protein